MLSHDPNIEHVISAEKLIELLESLPTGSYVVPNQVNNLAILDGPLGAESPPEQIGFIDLCFGRVELDR